MTHSPRTQVFSRRRDSYPVQTTVAAPPPSHEEIARLAYAYWEARGYAHGFAHEDWLRAERELLHRRSFAPPEHRL